MEEEEGLLESAGAWVGEQLGDAWDYLVGDEEDEQADADFLGSLLGGGAGAANFSGPSGMQLADIAAAGGAIAPYLPPGAVNAAGQLVGAILGDSPTAAAARELLAKATGWVFNRGPSYQGAPLTFAMANMMLSTLPLDEVRAIAWRASGGESPSPAASKKEREAFALLYLYDAVRALNATDAAQLIIQQTPARKPRR